MKCPLSGIEKREGTLGVFWYGTECAELQCAWYDDEKNVCSIKALAKELTRIQLKLSNISSKIPLGVIK